MDKSENKIPITLNKYGGETVFIFCELNKIDIGGIGRLLPTWYYLGGFDQPDRQPFFFKFSSGLLPKSTKLMATNILKLPIARVACRGLATQAAAAQREISGQQGEINCTLLPNKILVSSQDLYGGLSRISVAFRTGSRNEVYKNAGVTHVIRSMAGFSTQQFTDFLILRNIQQVGGYLTCTGDREMTSFNIVGTRDNIYQLFGFLASVVSGPAFKPWQIKRNFPRLKYEISLLSPQVETMELLHKAAFRTGLGNPLFITEEQIGAHNYDVISDFYVNGFTSNRAAVIGYNLTHRDVVRFAESFTLPAGDPPAGNSTYFGGEIRKEKSSYFATVAIAAQGVGSKDMKQALVYGVLQHALGASPVIKWGGSPSPLNKSIASASPSAGATCFNISYSDNGLFGVMFQTSAQNAGSVTEAAWKVLKSGQLSDADIKRGKSLLKMKILDCAGCSENFLEDMANQSLVSGAVVPASVLAEAIDKISTSDVQGAAKKVASGKFSMAAFGNLSEVPYLDQLK